MRAIVNGLKSLANALKNSYSSYVMEGLLTNSMSEDQTTRVLARMKLREQFPDAYRELRRMKVTARAVYHHRAH